MPIAIKIENLSKQYRLGLISTRTLSHDLNRWYQMNIRGKGDPYLKIGENSGKGGSTIKDYIWALRDINLEVEQGEVLGIIGKNGAGKSTLLKILSKVTAPTTGTVKARGRIASLLEVGTGFHPEMTGRENIYMNGAIMGMSKAEITRKLDEIVDFAGVGTFIDTPVKRYSSGMTVRLGFAVAAHLEPEILVVDEVLAVGDMEFQGKAVAKMQELSRNSGNTVLFVSHNINALKSLCNNGILIKDGQINCAGDIEKMINEYIIENETNLALKLDTENKRDGNGIVKFTEFYVTDLSGNKLSLILTGSNVVFNFKVRAEKKCTVDLGFSFFTLDGQMISNLFSSHQNYFANVEQGLSTITCEIKDFPFCLEKAIIRGMIYVDNELSDWPKSHIGLIRIEKSDFYETGKNSSPNIQFLFKGKWDTK